jgi:hydroxymethylglutaryl-CoA lyase
VALLEEMGVRTGVDVPAMIDAGIRGEEVLGQKLRSNVIRAGPVIHGESSPEKEPGAVPVPAT